MMNDWEECIQIGQSIGISIDSEKEIALTKVAQGRITFLDKLAITNESCNYIFEGLYTSLIELLHAITIGRGIKVKNHVCLGMYLRDVLQKQTLYEIFEDLRYKRNSLVYYGKDMEFKVAQEAILNTKTAIQEIKTI